MKQTVSEKLEARRAAGIEIATAIRDVSKKLTHFDRNELLALAERIQLCNSKNNQFRATDFANFETGEAFEAHGTFWACGSKLCSNCLAKRSRESRKKLTAAVDRQKLEKGERFLFVTLTIKNPNQSLLKTREIVNRSWELFRKRKLLVDLVAGGCKSEEFTLTANGFHYHLHLMLRCRWFQFNEFRRVWTECVEKAFEEAKLPFIVDTKDGLLIVNFKKLTGMQRAIQEVCKYITKSDSWTKMKPQDLAEICLVKRWNRMFEIFGSFAESRQREAYVHTKPLSDGGSPSETEYWREKVEKIGFENYRTELFAEFANVRAARIAQILRKQTACKLFDGNNRQLGFEDT